MNFSNYFSAWNHRDDLNIVLPELYAKDYLNIPESDLEVTFFNASTELEEIENRDSILYGRNFNHQSLHLCQTVDNARLVLDLLLTKIPETNYLAYIINAGPTGLTLEVGSRATFQTVVAHGYGVMYRDMLIRNINVFNLGNKIIPMYDYNGILLDSKMKGCLLFIDNLFKDGRGKLYIDDDFKVYLLDFLNNNRSVVTAVVVRAQVSEDLAGYDIINVADSTIYLNQNPRILPVANNGGLTAFPESALMTILSQRLPETVYSSSIYHNYDSKSVCYQSTERPIVSIFGNKPTKKWATLVSEVSKIDPGQHAKGSKEWLLKFREMIVRFLKVILHKSEIEEELGDGIKEMISKMVTVENLKRYWVVAVVHESCNAENNYEVLEAIGDRYAEASFINYIFENYPKATPSVINGFVNEYLATGYFSLFAKQLELPKWVMSSFTVDDNISEDVLEAWFGAIYLTSESYRAGMGMRVINLFINAIYSSLNLMDNDVAIGNKSTIHNQYDLGPKVKLFSASESIKDSVFKYVLKIEPAALEFFRNNGIDVSKINPATPIIGIGGTTGQAKNDANNKLYTYLKQFGITYEFMSQIAAKKKLAAYPANNELMAKVKIKALRSGISKVDYKKVDKEGPKIGYILYGEKADGTKVNLATIEIARKFDLTANQNTSISLYNLFNKYLMG